MPHEHHEGTLCVKQNDILQLGLLSTASTMYVSITPISMPVKTTMSPDLTPGIRAIVNYLHIQC
jgi:hypothetical protein